MQVSTGLIHDSIGTARAAGIPDDDLVEVLGTREQVDALSRAVRAGKAEEKRKAARRAQQRSRRANRR